MDHRTQKVIAAFMAVQAGILLFAGAGCTGPAAVDKATGEVINGAIVVPLKALEKSKELTGDENARARLQAESIANEMTVAMVLTEGAVVPSGAVLGETFGCSDRIVLVKVPRESESDNTLRDVLTSLFAVREFSFGKYYNGLADSRLEVVKTQNRDGDIMEVWLKGTISSPGVCNDPRIKKQIEATVGRLYPNFKIFLNGSEAAYNCIGDMSGQCGTGQ
jgi:hypothetical protein